MGEDLRLRSLGSFAVAARDEALIRASRQADGPISFTCNPELVDRMLAAFERHCQAQELGAAIAATWKRHRQ